MINLKKWQVQAYEKLRENNYNGIVCAATGSGKTHLGLKLIEENLTQKILVVVPTIVLMEQWFSLIKNNFNMISGRIGGGYDEEGPITIAVINSVREVNLDYEILILDEAHHYLSDVNVKLLKNNKFEKILGLSATIERSDERTYTPFGLKIIYDYSQFDAVQNKDLARFNIINVGVDFTTKEREKYILHDGIVKNLLKKYDYKTLYVGPQNYEKMQLRRSIFYRKKLVNCSVNKILTTIKIVQENPNNKIIIFSEFIQVANEIGRLLTKYEVKNSIYHSDIGKKEKELIFKNFKDGIIRVLVSVKALDEGIDVPDCDIGILVGGSSTERQIIQRFGRVLRYKNHKAFIYQLYVKDSVEIRQLRTKLGFIKGASEVSFIDADDLNSNL